MTWRHGFVWTPAAFCCCGYCSRFPNVVKCSRQRWWKDLRWLRIWSHLATRLYPWPFHDGVGSPRPSFCWSMLIGRYPQISAALRIRVWKRSEHPSMCCSPPVRWGLLGFILVSPPKSPWAFGMTHRESHGKNGGCSSLGWYDDDTCNSWGPRWWNC